MTIETQHPALSIVIAVHNQATALEENLPSFLTLPYEGEYEVIVVDDMSTDDTPNVLKRMKTEYPRLYSTFLPKSVIINPSRLRLALNVGVKAAHHDYVVLANINFPPVNAEWLEGLADGEASLVYSTRKRDNVTHVVATQLEDFIPVVRKAERRSCRGHQGKWFKRRRGLYDALCIRRKRMFDAIKLFDLPIRGRRLMGLRLRVWLGL